MPAVDFAYDQKSGFILCLCRNLQEIRVIPQELRFPEIKPVLFLIQPAFFWVKFKFHI